MNPDQEIVATSPNWRAVDHLGFEWPVEFMRRVYFKKGQVLFKLGDRAEELFLIARGAVRLPEFNRVLGPSEVFGEIGLFSPDRSRTASAVAEEDVEAYSMGGEEVRKLMTRDPALATLLIQVVVQRMTEDLKAEVEARERAKAELRVARNIQMSMLPQPLPALPDRREFEICAFMEPASEVGGDFYDFFLTADCKLWVLVGDVSGKGIPAALLMALSKTLLRSEAMKGLAPANVLRQVNLALCEGNQECMFVTVFCLVLDPQTGLVEFCSAGHNPAVLCSKEGEAEFLDCRTDLLLGFEKQANYHSFRRHLNRGDTVILYTDGLTDAEDPQGAVFSDERLRACVAALHSRDLPEIVNGLKAEVAIHAATQAQSDDMTLVALRYAGTQ